MKTFNQFLLETLTKNASAKDWIDDFVNSTDPKFEGKSKEERTNMALAAFYAKQGKVDESMTSVASAMHKDLIVETPIIGPVHHPNTPSNGSLSKGRSGVLSVNMDQFKDKWKTFSDNVRLADNISNTNGKFFTFDVTPYLDWLNDFNIFYTFTEKDSPI